MRRLLDIGAYHPTCFSNSRALIESGWDALLIEPAPMPVRNLVKEYGGNPQLQPLDPKPQYINVLCAAVGAEPGIITLQITDDAVSTSDPANQERWKDRGGYLGAMMIPCLTIPQILDQFGAFDFVNLDVEGGSVDLFKVLLATEMFPRCICVEHDGRIIEAMGSARARGYVSVLETEENLVFAHER